jgi:hypothetical protein
MPASRLISSLAGFLLPALVAIGQSPPAAANSWRAPDPTQPAKLASLAGHQPESTRAMARKLAQIRDRADPNSMAFLSDRIVLAIREAIAASTNLQQTVQLQFRLGVQLIQAGETETALDQFKRLEEQVSQVGGKFGGRGRVDLRMRKAIALLRLGEQENCLINHSGESCLFPLQPSAVHQLPRGSKGAVALLNEQLAEFPDDLSPRWLLNIAHMTLGEYPDKVPQQWLIPPKTFASEHPMPRFPEAAGALGLDVMDLAGGCILDDFDNDGFIDLVSSSWGLKGQLRFFRNDGTGKFNERTREAGFEGLVSGLNLMQTDYNNDGWLDIWVPRGAWLGKAGRIPNSLLRNNGDGTFTDVTEAAGLFSLHPTQTSAWFDYDGDGWLDVFVGNESTDPKDPDFCELFHNNRDGTFTNVAKESGVDFARFVKGVACGDYDNDGRPDLYLSCREGPNLLLHNDGPAEPPPVSSGRWKFSEVSRLAGVSEPIYSFPTWFFDYDNDGWQDLFVSGYALRNVGDVAADYLGLPHNAAFPKLYRNNRDGTFADVTAGARLNRVCHSMGANFGDLDNDGWLDFYLGTGDPEFTTLIPNRMFRNAGGKFFQDVTTATGTGHLQKGHAVAFVDLDHDGDQDVFADMGGAFTGDVYQNAFFLNPGAGGTNRWLKLKLEGTKSNRAAIGARIKVSLETPDGPRELFKIVNSGGSFGANPLRQELGLANATAIKSVEVFWPTTGLRQLFTDLEANRCYRIREGDARAESWELKPLQFDLSVRHSHKSAPLAGP